MKQLGNLAIVCAQRQDVALTLLRGQVQITAYQKCGRETMIAEWDDDEAIRRIIRELNFGKYAEKAA